MDTLFDRLNTIKQEYDLIRNREEKFNIFSVLHKEHDERRLHSRFIAALLNPIGSHGMKNVFLETFLDFFPHLNGAKFKQAVVYPKEIEKSEHLNIDILILDEVTKHAIIIENKIYAGDSNNRDGGQLERYYDTIYREKKIPKDQIYVFYLTLDGHAPSRQSFGKYESFENIPGECISYGEHILNWLSKCQKLVAGKTFLETALQQYEKLIKKMTHNNIDIEERQKIKAAIGKDKSSLMATKYLIDNFKHVKWHTIADFWNELACILKERGYKNIRNEVSVHTITAITHYDNNKTEEDSGISFQIIEGLRGYIWHYPYENLCYGFEKKGINDKYAQKLNKLVDQNIIGLNSTKTEWYINFDFSLKNFSSEKTFSLINPKYRRQVIKEVISEIQNFCQRVII